MPDILAQDTVKFIDQALPELRARPGDYSVITSMRDGAYWMQIDKEVQIIVVGPMLFTPGEYAIAASLQYADAPGALTIQSLEFMGPSNPAERHLMLRRGFVNIMLRDCRSDLKEP
jgi:hypothetical protein